MDIFEKTNGKAVKMIIIINEKESKALVDVVEAGYLSNKKKQTWKKLSKEFNNHLPWFK